MTMRTVDPVVAYCIQNNMYNLAIVVANLKRLSNGVLDHGCGLVYIGKSWAVLEFDIYKQYPCSFLSLFYMKPDVASLTFSEISDNITI